MAGYSIYSVIGEFLTWMKDNGVTIIVAAIIPLVLQLLQVRKTKAESHKLSQESNSIAVDSANKAIGVWESVVEEIKKKSDDCVTENEKLTKRIVELTDEINNIRAQQATLISTVETIIRIFSDIKPDTVILSTPDGKIEYVSLNISDLLGYDVSEFLTKNIFELFHNDDRAQFALTLQQILLVNNTTIGYRGRVRTRSNVYKWMEITGTNVNAPERLRGLLLSFRDITERKGIEEVFTKMYAKPANTEG